jgi:cobyrinic acid a,c-diamide synthase
VSAAGPPQGARPLRQEGGREAASAASLGEGRTTAVGPLRFLVSAAHKSSGKTTVSIGLAAALTARGRSVQTFKKGPDFIDPMWLTAASGRRCRNLDPWLSPDDEIVETFRRHAAGADIALVEGNKGLYDGLALDGSNSNAALAKTLGLPVVLVLDARGMTRGIAPLILGYQAFDRELTIVGVVLNNLGGSRHEAKLRMVIEHYTDVAVVGAVHHDPRLTIVERHLGLMPSNESDDVPRRITDLGAAIGRQVDLDLLLSRVAAAPPLPEPALVTMPHPAVPDSDIRIGVAQDRAFGFYYPDDLDALRAAGATLVRFDTLTDTHLPSVDALFIGGGFPELYARELEANAALRGRVRSAIDAGLPVYAECGGLMYLARSLTVAGQTSRMVGAIPGDVVMRERPVGRGYVVLEETDAFPWPTAGGGRTVRAHEFHYASLENLPTDVRCAYVVKRGHGIDGERDGVVVGNVLASFAHLRSTRDRDWAARFVEFIRASDYRQRRDGNIVYLAPMRGREALIV